MSWKRLATFALGGLSVVGGVLIPGAGLYLLPAGAGLIGWATKWPGDRTKKQREDEVTPTVRKTP